jgi:hypothetical protein
MTSYTFTLTQYEGTLNDSDQIVSRSSGEAIVY